MVAGRRLRCAMACLAQMMSVTSLLLLIGTVSGARPCAADEDRRLLRRQDHHHSGRLPRLAAAATTFMPGWPPSFLAVICPDSPPSSCRTCPAPEDWWRPFLLDVRAAKDGTTLGIPSQTIVFDTLLGYSAGVDAGRFQWLGRMAMNVEVGAAFATTGISSMAHLRTRQISIGGTGGTAGSSVIPFLLNKLGEQIQPRRVKATEESTVEVILAMRRGELDMVGGVGLATLQARFGNEMKDGSLRVIYQTGFSRHPDIPDVPDIDEFGRTEEEKQMLALLSYIAAVGRSIVAPPGVPPARIAALQKAIAVMLADPAVLTFASEHTIKLAPGSAEDIDTIITQDADDVSGSRGKDARGSQIRGKSGSRSRGQA